jgi:hypothetical protein
MVGDLFVHYMLFPLAVFAAGLLDLIIETWRQLLVVYGFYRLIKWGGRKCLTK